MHMKSSCIFAYKFKYYIIKNSGTYKESKSTLKFEKLFTNYLKILAVMILSWHWALKSSLTFISTLALKQQLFQLFVMKDMLLFFPNPSQTESL